MKTFALALVSIGVFCMLVSAFLFWQQTNPSRLSFDVTFSGKKQTVTSEKKPKRISIAKENIDLPIIVSHVTKGKWETTTKGISYLGISPTPGDTGNSILYGHNFDNLFGKLPYLIPGDTIQITYEDNSKKDFVIKYTQIVTPKQIDIVKQTTDKRLTLYTCTGLFDSQRFVVIATPKS